MHCRMQRLYKREIISRHLLGSVEKIYNDTWQLETSHIARSLSHDSRSSTPTIESHECGQFTSRSQRRSVPPLTFLIAQICREIVRRIPIRNHLFSYRCRSSEIKPCWDYQPHSWTNPFYTFVLPRLHLLSDTSDLRIIRCFHLNPDLRNDRIISFDSKQGP